MERDLERVLDRDLDLMKINLTMAVDPDSFSFLEPHSICRSSSESRSKENSNNCNFIKKFQFRPASMFFFYFLAIFLQQKTPSEFILLKVCKALKTQLDQNPHRENQLDSDTQKNKTNPQL